MLSKATSIKTVKELLAQKSLAPRKSLGQNFLVDENIARKIVAAANVTPDDRVLEIGPGLGALTEHLITMAAQVTTVEYDRGLAAVLTERLGNATNFRLINQDVLKVNLDELLAPERQTGARLKVLANLPYYITSPIIFQLLETAIPWERMVFLMQKEVGERICAKPGTKDYGALTVMLGFYGTVEFLGMIPRTVFYPSPQVDSALIRIMPRPETDRALHPVLYRIVQAAFGQRRKTVLNALAAGEILPNREELEGFLRDEGIDPGRRGETLTGAEFLRLAQRLHVINGL